MVVVVVERDTGNPRVLLRHWCRERSGRVPCNLRARAPPADSQARNTSRMMTRGAVRPKVAVSVGYSEVEVEVSCSKAAWKSAKHLPGHRCTPQTGQPLLVVLVRPLGVTPLCSRHHLHRLGYIPGILEQ